LKRKKKEKKGKKRRKKRRKKNELEMTKATILNNISVG
jgi:hypothetical protein